jgi:putative ABC transport system permease protein
VQVSSLHFKWALKNLWRNPRRSIVTGLAISSGFMGLMLFQGYFHRIERTLATMSFLTQGVGHVNVYKKGGLEKAFLKPKNFALTPENIKELQGFFETYKSDIAYQTGLYSGVGLIGNGCRSVPFLVKGIDPELQNWLFQSSGFGKWAEYLKPVREGKDFASFAATEGVIATTVNLALLLNKKELYRGPESKMKPWAATDCESQEIRQKVSADPAVQLLAKTVDGGISAIDAQIGGLFKTGTIYTEDMAVNAPLKMVQRLYDTDKVSKWLLYLQDESLLKTWKSQVKFEFEEKLPHLEMLFYDEPRANPFYTGVVAFLAGMGGFFTIIICLVVGLSISNSTTMNLLERSQEIGTLRSLGLTPENLNIILTIESFWLSLISILFGAVMTSVVATSINQAKILFEPPGGSDKLQLLVYPEFSVGLFLALFLTIFVAVVTYYLARGITRRKVVELLTTS